MLPMYVSQTYRVKGRYNSYRPTPIDYRIPGVIACVPYRISARHVQLPMYINIISLHGRPLPPDQIKGYIVLIYYCCKYGIWNHCSIWWIQKIAWTRFCGGVISGFMPHLFEWTGDAWENCGKYVRRNRLENKHIETKTIGKTSISE